MITPIDPNDWTAGFLLSQDDPALIYPSKEYANAEQFFSNFGQMSIPFLDGYSIQSVPDKAEDGETDNICFNEAYQSLLLP